jgi:hypothetical protein
MIEIDENDTGILKALTEICLNLQRQYDISPELINTLINDPVLKEMSENINQKLFSDLVETLDKIIDSSDIDLSGNKINSSGDDFGWQAELCGYILEEYPNGYKKYCNQHKYMHKTDLNHKFVTKTQEQVAEESLFELKHQHYQNYINDLFRILMEYVINQLKRDYQVIRIRAEDIWVINEILKKYQTCFKSREPIQQVIKNANNQYINQTFLDIYLDNQDILGLIQPKVNYVEVKFI